MNFERFDQIHGMGAPTVRRCASLCMDARDLGYKMRIVQISRTQGVAEALRPDGSKVAGPLATSPARALIGLTEQLSHELIERKR
jgi:hypothetical protein